MLPYKEIEIFLTQAFYEVYRVKGVSLSLSKKNSKMLFFSFLLTPPTPFKSHALY